MLHQAPANDKKNQRKFKKAAEMIWEICGCRFQKTKEKDDRLIIAISGESGSGKSSIAYYLCKLFMEKSEKEAKGLFNNSQKATVDTRLTEIYNHMLPSAKKKAKHLWADDLYVENYQMMDPAERSKRREENKYQTIGPKEYAWKEIAAILTAFRNGNKCRMPCVDLLNQQIDWLETDFQDVSILIIEGIFAIDMDGDTLKADYMFFIEGGTDSHQDGGEQEENTSVRKKILHAEKKALEKIKEERIKKNKLIVLSYDKQALSWKLDDFYL